MEIQPQTITYDSLPNANFKDAKKLSTGKVRITSDDQKNGEVQIQAGYTHRVDRELGNRGTVIDITDTNGNMVIDGQFNIVVKPQDIGNGGGLLIKNIFENQAMVVWKNGEQIVLDKDNPSIKTKAGDVVYAMVGETRAIKLTKVDPFSKTIELKNFQLDEQRGVENNYTRMVKSDKKEMGAELPKDYSNKLSLDERERAIPGVGLVLDGEFIVGDQKIKFITIDDRTQAVIENKVRVRVGQVISVEGRKYKIGKRGNNWKLKAI